MQRASSGVGASVPGNVRGGSNVSVVSNVYKVIVCNI